MEPVALAGTISLLAARAAVRALVRGDLPDRDEWGGLVADVLEAVVAGHSATERSLGRVERALRRIEDTLDQIDSRSFTTPFMSAISALADARQVRDEQHRQSLLRRAGAELRNAAAAARDPHLQAHALWYLALTFLLDQEPTAALRTLETARDHAVLATLRARDRWAQPLEHDVERHLDQHIDAGRWSGRRARDAHRPAITARLRDEAADLTREAAQLAADIQATRAALGVDAADCAAPTLAPGAGSVPELIIRLRRGSNNILGYAVTIADITIQRPPRHVPVTGLTRAQRDPFTHTGTGRGRSRPWKVRARVAVTFPATAPSGSCTLSVRVRGTLSSSHLAPAGSPFGLTTSHPPRHQFHRPTTLSGSAGRKIIEPVEITAYEEPRSLILALRPFGDAGPLSPLISVAELSYSNT